MTSRFEVLGALRPGKRAAGIAVAILVLALAVVSGSMDGSNQALTDMGFDPDRAQLITGLLLGAIASGASVFAGTSVKLSALLGCAGSTLLFGPTFVAETQSALASTGAAGSFALGGWLITTVTLVVSGLVSGWAGAALATAAQPSLASAVRAVAQGIRARRVSRDNLRRVAPVAAIALTLVLTVPVFGDMVNYTPDSRMLQGGPSLIGLGGANLTAPPAVGPTPSSVASAGPSPIGTPGTSPSPAGSTSPVDPHPWLAWRPTGVGRVTAVALAGPWKGGTPTADVTVYTPPGYSAKGTRRYPVLYEAPYAFSHWNDAAGAGAALDTLINRGAIPPIIVVAMSTAGGPYSDSECTDSYDGREWFDSYVADTVVPWVDANYLTIATRAARSVLGASQGGYCAAALAARHPDLFGTSLVYSGYFHAGGVGPPSTIPFGTDPAFINAASPDYLIFRLSAGDKASLYYILVALLSQPLYGEEAVRFDGLLTQAGMDHKVISASVPHGWRQLRDGFAAGLEAWAARMVFLGVF